MHDVVVDETNETNVGIIVNRGHELDTWHGNMNTKKHGMKPHKTKGLVK
jgi:hypothetical protein